MLETEQRLEARHYEATDLDWLSTRTPEGWFDATAIPRLADPTLSVSFYDGDGYCGSTGLFRLWHGVYEAWLVLAAPPRNTWDFLWQMRRAIIIGQRLTQAHRLQAYCLAEYAQGLVLAKRLGFRQECVMVGATPMNTDLVLLAKVRR